MKKLLFLPLTIFLLSLDANSQYTIKSLEGYSPQIGTLVNMLDDLKTRITHDVQELDQAGTDFLADESSNRIGAIIMHLAATEYYYQQATFYESELDPDRDAEWMPALDLGDNAREMYVGRPISYYLGKWDEVRNKTKEVLKTKDDVWLLEVREPGDEDEYNYYYVWYHVMEHQAAHMGQIAVNKKKIKN